MSSSLYFCSGRHAEERMLVRRHHDLGGTDYTYIARLPREASEAISSGAAHLRVRLRDDWEDGKAPWRLDVMMEDASRHHCYLDEHRFNELTMTPDRLRVEILGGELALMYRTLQKRQSDVANATRQVEMARENLEAFTVKLKEALFGGVKLDIPIRDGDAEKYRILSDGKSRMQVLRFGEAWRDITHEDRHIAHLANLLEMHRADISNLGGDPEAYAEGPARYGAEQDLLRVETPFGGLLRQDANGATSYEDVFGVIDVTGDNLALSLGYEIERCIALKATLEPAPTVSPDM